MKLFKINLNLKTVLLKTNNQLDPTPLLRVKMILDHKNKNISCLYQGNVQWKEVMKIYNRLIWKTNCKFCNWIKVRRVAIAKFLQIKAELEQKTWKNTKWLSLRKRIHPLKAFNQIQIKVSNNIQIQIGLNLKQR